MGNKISSLSATLISVGILIGFGIFFKADDMYLLNGVHPQLLIVSWIIVGFITIMGAYCIGQVVPLTEKSEGIATYMELTNGKLLAYFTTIFMIIMYTPIYLGLLSKMFASYFFDLFNLEHSNYIYLVAVIILTFVFLWNYVSTKFAVKVSDLATIIKLIPLIFVFLIGLFFGEIDSSYTQTISYVEPKSLIVIILAPLTAMMITMDGWISIGSLSSRLNDPERNIPKIFVYTLLIVLGAYILYFIGIDLAFDIEHTNWAVIGNSYLPILFENYFGQVGVSLVLTLVLISGLGCINGFYISGLGYIESAASKNLIPFSSKFTFDKSLKGARFSTSVLLYALGLIYLFIYFLQDNSTLFSGVIIEDISILIVSIFFFILYISIVIFAVKKKYKIKKIIPSAIIATIGQILIMLSFIINTENAIFYVIIVFFMLIISLFINKKFNEDFSLDY